MKTNKILALAMSVIVAAGMASCSDDEPQATPLASPTASAGEATYNTLTFSWDKVERATKYGYTLATGTGHELVTDVTSLTSVTFTDLEPSTEYTLSVWAYGVFKSADGTSEVTTITKRTSDIIYLAAPELSAKMSGTRLSVSWDKVSGAEEYEYEVLNPDGSEGLSGSTTATSLSIGNLVVGTYVIRVRALTTQGGYGNSDWTSVEFPVTMIKQWAVDGAYYCAELDRTFDAQMIYYGQDTYTIEAFMGVQGYNLTFTVNSGEHAVSMYGNYEYNSSWYFVVPTGQSALPNLQIYAWYDYCSFEGTQEGGEMYLYTSYTATSEKYDSFTWGDTTPKPSALCGDWTMKTTGWEYLSGSSWQEYSYGGTIEVTLNPDDESQIVISDVYWTGYPFKGTVDMEKLTVTFEPQEWGYYVFAGEESPEAPVVGTISSDLNKITLKDFGCWYIAYDYNYLYATEYTLTRGSATAPAKVKGATQPKAQPAPARRPASSRR